jgi:UDP-N-acetylmuramate--alanine ligase
VYNFRKHSLHFIGIGGSGMSGIAEILLNLGYRVSGSDLKRSDVTDHLVNSGAKISFGHSTDSIPKETTAVVVSSAIREGNPELVWAREQNISVLQRAEMLAELMRMRYGVAIAGAHGKTTTTTMVGQLLRDAGFDPTVIVGGRILSSPSGARLGLGEYLVAEADESDGSFLLLQPSIAVVTNLDHEHLTHYGTVGNLEEAFLEFMNKVPFYGLVVCCGDDSALSLLRKQVRRRVVTYGVTPLSEFYATDILVERGATQFTLHAEGRAERGWTIPCLGTHMVMNALAAIAVGRELEIPFEVIRRSLSKFPGVHRRSEVVGEVAGVTVIDDYGHHPTEILATLKSIREGFVRGDSKLHVIFQPHRYSRTHDLFSEFITSFGSADMLYLTEIYSAGEDPIPQISGESLAEAILNVPTQFVGSLAESIQPLLSTLVPGDIVVTLGAGSVGTWGKEVVSAMKANEKEIQSRKKHEVQAVTH